MPLIDTTLFAKRRDKFVHIPIILCSRQTLPQRSSEELFAYHFYSFFLLTQANALPSSTLSGFMPD